MNSRNATTTTASQFRQPRLVFIATSVVPISSTPTISSAQTLKIASTTAIATTVTATTMIRSVNFTSKTLFQKSSLFTVRNNVHICRLVSYSCNKKFLKFTHRLLIRWNRTTMSTPALSPALSPGSNPTFHPKNLNPMKKKTDVLTLKPFHLSYFFPFLEPLIVMHRGSVGYGNDPCT